MNSSRQPADATHQSAPESHRQVNDRFPLQIAEVEFVSRCPVHEQTVIIRRQLWLTLTANIYNHCDFKVIMLVFI